MIDKNLKILHALQDWLYQGRAKDLISIYLSDPLSLNFLPKGEESFYYRQIKISRFELEQLILGKNLNFKKPLESWSNKEDTKGQFLLPHDNSEYVITLKKYLLLKDQVAYLPQCDLGFGLSDCYEEKELIALASTVELKDLYQIEYFNKELKKVKVMFKEFLMTDKS